MCEAAPAMRPSTKAPPTIYMMPGVNEVDRAELERLQALQPPNAPSKAPQKKWIQNFDQFHFGYPLI